jgi:hypothetical protein
MNKSASFVLLTFLILGCFWISTPPAVHGLAVGEGDASECAAYGCHRAETAPQYSNPTANCGQYVAESAATGTDGACICEGEEFEGEVYWYCSEVSSECAGAKTYTITPPTNNHRLCEWTNYPTTPQVYAPTAYGAPGTVVLSVAGCGSKDQSMAYLMVRPSTGPDDCSANMTYLCNMLFKFECKNCDLGCP